MYKIIIVLFAIICSFSLTTLGLPGNQIKMNSITATDGLASNSVYAITQDQVGFMWFGTTRGLNRYDGKIIKTYQASPYKNQCISDSRVNCLLCSKSGELFIGTEKGLNIYLRDKDIVVAYNAAARINNNRIRTLAEDGDLLWIGTNSGLFSLDRKNGEITEFNVNNSGLANNIIRTIYVDQDNLYLGTFDGVSCYNKKNKKWRNVNLKPDYIRLPQNNLVLSMTQSPFDANILLVGTQTGFCELNKNTLSYTLHEKSQNNNMVNNTIKTMCCVSGSVWLGSEEGLMIFNNKNFVSCGYDPDNQHSLPNNIVWSIFQDKNNIVWLGTEGGVAKYDAGIPEFTYVDLVKAIDNPNIGMSIFAAQIDKDGNIWMGSRFGLSKYNPLTNQMQWIPFSNAIFGTYNFIRGLFLDHNGILWVGTAEGIICYDTLLKREIKIQQKLKNRLKYINVVKQADDGKICACDVNGCIQMIGFIFDPINREFTSVEDEFISIGEEVHTMTLDKNYIWMGTAGNGIIRYDRKDGVIKKYISAVNDSTSISSDIINDLFIDKNTGILWIGSDKGLDKYNKRSDNFWRISSLGVPGAVYTIQSDNTGMLWLSTKQSIVCYKQSSKSFNFYPLKNWINISKNIPSVTFADSCNNVYVMGLDGYIRMNQSNMKQKRMSAPLYITDIKVVNQSIVDLDINKGLPIERIKKIRLEHSVNDVISFYFSMFDYSSPLLVRYTYILDGYDAEWKTIDGTKPFIEYPRLSPGKYKLQVRAESSEGISASNKISLDIVILPPWWLSWWAYSVYSLLGAGIFYAFIQFRNRRNVMMNELRIEKLQREKIEEINQVKLRFFTNISHDLKTPLSLIISPVDSILDIETDPEKIYNLDIIKQNAQRLLRLVTQILDFRKVENQKMKLNIQSSDIVSTIKNISLTFNELAIRKGIRLLFETEIESLVMDFDVDKIEKIFLNLISNALQFTPKGEQIIINIQIKDTDHIDIMVADTGVGIPDNELPFIFDRFYQVEEHTNVNFIGSGIGLTIVKEFVELHKGSIKVHSRTNEGSTFFVTLPVINSQREENKEAVEEMDRLMVTGKTNLTEGDYTVLVIEDNDDLRSYLQMELSKNYSVIAVGNAVTGYDVIKKDLPDIVISDIMLPGMSGVELCRRIKNEFATSHIPVILLTAKTAEEHVIEGFDAGADEYIGKPFNLKVLKSRIENIIIQRQKLIDKLKQDTIELSPVETQSPNEIFISRVVLLIEENLSDTDLNIAFLCDKLAVSHVSFYRKVKSMTGLNVNSLIRDIKLKKAAQLLRVKGLSVTDVMYEVGFNHRSYFSQCFREMFGETPKIYAQKFNNNEISG